MKNNFAFIDSQNLNLSVINQGWKLDFHKFRIYIKHKFHITQAFLFIGYIPGNESLYTSLQKAGYILVHKPILELENGKIKGNVDAELVLHAMIEYQNYDGAVIVSGDGDFYCLVEYLQKQNKLERLIIPDRKKYSSFYKNQNLRGFITFLNNMEEKLGRKS